jgi:hypothetical protein
MTKKNDVKKRVPFDNQEQQKTFEQEKQKQRLNEDKKTTAAK